MNDVSTPRKPEPRPTVWMTEDGDYFGEGHIDPKAFKAACLWYDVHEVGIDPVEEGSDDMDTAAVVHEWWRPVGPDDSEMIRRCGPEHRRAIPLTAWRR